jgi:hypothetical protein
MHGEPLRSSIVKSTGVERFLWHLPEEDRLGSDCQSAPEASLKALHAIAELTTKLVEFAASDGWLDASLVQSTLRTRLSENGGITGGGNVRITDAATDYLRHCMNLRSAPEFIGLPANLEESKAQVSHLLRPFRSGTHPLRLLVAINWLFEDVSYFIKSHIKDTIADVKDPVFELVNKQSVETQNQVERKSALVDLVRSGESVSAAAIKIGVDVATAQVWVAKEGISIRRRPKILTKSVLASIVRELENGADKLSVARQHGISVVTVTKTLRTEVGLHSAWQTAKAANAQQSVRKAWLDLLASHGGIGIKLMRAMNPAAYAWLYRNDRAWLTEHASTVGINAKPGRASSVRWDERDDLLSRTVSQVALRLSQDQLGKPLRLCQIYQAIPELRAKLHALNRLPLTKHAIEVALGRRRTKAISEDLFN